MAGRRLHTYKTYKVERFITSIVASNIGGFFDHEMIPDRIIRPERVGFNVRKEGQAVATGIYVGGQNQLVQEIDCYRMSFALDDKLCEDFLREYGLQNATDAMIDQYLDDNELSIPKSTAVAIPVVGQDGKSVRICGRVLDPTLTMVTLIIIGVVVVPQKD